MYPPPNHHTYPQPPDEQWVTAQTPQQPMQQQQQQQHPQQQHPHPHQPQHPHQQPPQQSLPPIQHMAHPRLLPGMHAPSGPPTYPPPYLPQHYYPPTYPPSHLPPQLPPELHPPPPPQSQPQDPAPRAALPLTHSGRNALYEFTLVVEQQPVRARMCGFGDKDRRPITPPPCVRLRIRDLRGQEVEAEGVNGSFFVLQVDLWNEKADREANVVRASNTASPTASISTATTTSFPPIPDRGSIGAMMHSHPAAIYGLPYGYPPALPPPPPHHPAPNNTMFTRNLIGSLTVNAAKLTDDDGKLGYWFVLQDLSVRTEGWFRLRMNFIDVGLAATPPASGGPSLNRGRAPVLAHVFSDGFQVFSAKRFPGVIESTELSKTFARQGVKIPIRKDGKEGREEEGEED
ncbi:hypothetical protein LTR53_017907 [Teratosphaeriaceae sp. CCFEE 6253]|nr:hypothetical protein LTR53_017907 [Teratosphaeriaceae sp. CCFEE 6253]